MKTPHISSSMIGKRERRRMPD